MAKDSRKSSLGPDIGHCEELRDEASPYNNLSNLFTKYNIVGYIIPSTDEYQNEYSPLSSKRLEAATGFTGSNGYALITKKKGYLLTDSRYLIQARDELDEFFEVINLAEHNALSLRGVEGEEAIQNDKNVSKDDNKCDKVIGYNPMLFTEAQIKAYFSDLKLVPIEEDLIDIIWQDKPTKPSTQAYLYENLYNGLDAISKIEKVRHKTGGKNLLITDPTSVCWLLNVRAADIPFCPIMLGRIILTDNKVMLFTDLRRISIEVKKALDFVEFYEEGEIFKHLDMVEIIDPKSCSIGLKSHIKNPRELPNPCMEYQMQKEDIEITNAKNAHIKDAAAVCEAMSWIEGQYANNLSFTEYDIGLKLSEFRSYQDGYVMDSFPPIVGFQESGAIVHYRAGLVTSKEIIGEGMLLLDSGGHYLGGTTDITRTIYFGTPNEEMKRRYTQVLKGHLAISMQRFPIGTSGGSLDILARRYLWQDGVDYGHGTGHGVGNLLSVHEGSMISKMGPILKENMILSNEPGFYKEGEYGIRIENLIYVKSISKNFLGFEQLTLVPYCHKLIDLALLDYKEMEYIKSYYSLIRDKIKPLLTDKAKRWLDAELANIL